MSQGATGNLQFTSGCITSGMLGAGVVFSGQIASGQVGWAHHSSGAIVSGQVGNGSVVSGSVASGQISTSHIASGALTSGLMSTAFISNIGAWFTNYLDNPFGMVAQNASVSLSSSLQYGSCDQWKASCSFVTGGALGQNSTFVTGFSTNFSLALTNVSTNNAGGTITVRQYIESKNANELINQTANFSCRVYSSTSAIISTLTVYKMSATNPDDPSSLTSLGSANTTLSPGNVVTMSTGGISMGDCSKGIVVELTIPGGVMTSQTFYVSDCILQIGSGVQVCERRSFQAELARCQRVYSKSQNYATPAGTGAYQGYASFTAVSSSQAFGGANYPVVLRSVVTPSIWAAVSNAAGSAYDTNTGTVIGGGGLVSVDNSDTGIRLISSAGLFTAGHVYILNWAADARF